MKSITIGRYNRILGTEECPAIPPGVEVSDVTDHYAGWIEGTTDKDERWIMWLDATGRPEIFWPNRDADGAVTGDGIQLDRAPGQFSGVFKQLGVSDDADADGNQPEVIASFPIFWDESTELEYDDKGRITNSYDGCMRASIFAVVPGDNLSPNDRLRMLLQALTKGLGLPDGTMQRAKMRSILDSGTPEEVVARLRRSLEPPSWDDESRKILSDLNDSRTTIEVKQPLSASDGLPDSSQPTT